MEERRIGGSPRDRRIGFIALTVGLVIAGGLGLWAWLAGDPWTAHDLRPLVALVGSILAGCSLLMAGLSFGYSVCGATHLETRSVLRRRSIPWHEIAAVEVASESGRGGTVYMVRVRMTGGRGSFIVPGSRSGGASEAVASAHRETIEAYRTGAATGTGTPGAGA
ncbi:PH domain-containing protein [Kitasatospora sp. NPDC058965]|uniref:PH domain-containing protein n=1 Tax=Kitasatospora sp. NPDC058965 TaxID=3346682 RepID=UPI0036CF927D